jgi:hypothetical protein
MKNLQLPGICLTLFFFCLTASAQNSIPVNEPDMKKPSLFTNLPVRIPVTISDLQNLLNTESGKDVSLRINQSAINSFNGKVVSAATKYNNIRSVVIRSSNFNGATFTLSSSIQPNGTVKFTGRIISMQHSDLYELQNKNDQYILIKKNFYDLINE